jgi:hypothetical protein
MANDLLAQLPCRETDKWLARLVRPALANGIWRDVVAPFALTRMALAIIAFGLSRLAPGEGSTPSITEFFSRFDQWWYRGIARNGYFFDPARQSSIAFAPLLPMLMRMIALPLGGGDWALIAAGAVVANAALVIGLIAVRGLAADVMGDRIARRAVLYILICPGTVFLSVLYPMSLMLAIAACSLWAATRGRWGLAGAVGMLAPLARPDGVLLIVPLICVALSSGRWDRRVAWLSMIPASFGLWLAAQWMALGTPLAFFHAQQMWEPSPLVTVLHSDRAGLILGMAAIFIGSTLVGWLKLPAALSMYSTLYLGLMLNAGRLWSLPRFVVILFPCFMIFAWLGVRHRYVHLLYVVASTVLAGVFTLRFALWLWVA